MNFPPRRVSASGLTTDEPPELPYQDPRTAVILRVASSPGFTRAPKLKSLFLDVMCNGLAGRDDLLSEVKIGHRVFGRPTVYNASEDTIVRAQMRLLRRKLEAYFIGEGRSEPIVITIPRGSYVPQFEPRAEAATEPRIETATEPRVEPAPEPPVHQAAVTESIETISFRPSQTRRYIFWLAPLALVAAFAAGWLLARKQPVPVVSQPKPVVHPILSRVFDRSRPTLAVVQDISVLLLNNALKTNFNPEDIQASSYKQRIAGPSLRPEQIRMLRFIDERQFTTVADLNITRYLSRAVPEYADQLQIVYPRHLHMRRFKESNVILIGGNLANPWARLFESRLKFQLVRENPEVWNLTLHNLEPRPGEQAVYRPGEYVYSILALLPNSGGDGTVLIMAGTSTEGTEAAAEVAMQPASARSLAERLNREAGPKGFTSFQAVIRSARVGGTSATSEIIALRVE